ncbi:MAG: glutamate--cysteine ligase [Actinocatenispora sp.]
MTIGVEEEFLLVDPATGLPAADAVRVLAVCAGAGGAHPAVLKHELTLSQVEAASAVCVDITDLRDQLAAARGLLAVGARKAGDWLLPVGHPVRSTGRDACFTPGVRFETIRELYEGVIRDYQTCGCHVHVGVPDRDTAVAVMNRVAPWLPTLLALSVNSVFDRGVDTGYHSWRAVLQSRFPGWGIPPTFGSALAYDREVDRLVDCGVLADRSMSFWLVRPSERFPTVEFRVADAAVTVKDAVLQAALSRALVRTALVDLEAGRPAPDAPRTVAAAALWSAARHGLAGAAIDISGARRIRAVDQAWRLVEYVTPALREVGDEATVRAGLNRLVRDGTGADRQRNAGDPDAAIAWLARACHPDG